MMMHCSRIQLFNQLTGRNQIWIDRKRMFNGVPPLSGGARSEAAKNEAEIFFVSHGWGGLVKIADNRLKF